MAKPYTMQVIDAVMGWRNLCLGDSSEMADRARFAELYADMQRKQRLNDLSEPGRLLPEKRTHELPPGSLSDLTQWIGGVVRSAKCKSLTRFAFCTLARDASKSCPT